MERTARNGRRTGPVTVRGTLATAAAFVGAVVAASYPVVAGAVALGAAGTLVGQRLGPWLDRHGEARPRSGPAARSGGETARR